MVATMSERHDPNQNHLLAALPEEILQRLSPHLELVSMPLGEVLCESSSQLHHVYFPTTAILSLHYVMENGASAEIAGVGNEGMFGISLFMGGITTTQPGHRADCRLWLPAESALDDGGIRSYRRAPRRRIARFVTALHPGTDYTDVPNCGLQPASFGGAASVPLAAVNPRPVTVE